MNDRCGFDLQGFGDANRLEIGRCCRMEKRCDASCWNKITQPTAVAPQLRFLVECGLVNARKERKVAALL